MSSNTKTGSASKIKMESFDDLFGGSSAQETGAEQIVNAPLADLGYEGYEPVLRSELPKDRKRAYESGRDCSLGWRQVYYAA